MSRPGRARIILWVTDGRLMRRIAFANPLLDFDKLLFIKRHDSVGVFHMCDQYYGCNAGAVKVWIKTVILSSPGFKSMVFHINLQENRLGKEKS